MASRKMAWWRRREASHSIGCVWASAVLPSMSVKRKVTVPLGALSMLVIGRVLGNERGDEFTAEGGNVGDDASPHEVTVAKSGFIHPGCAGVDEIIFDAQRASGTATFDNACRDGDEATVTDDADGLARGVHLAHEA